MNFVINLINRIKDFFFYLFFSASDDFKNKKLLRDIFELKIKEFEVKEIACNSAFEFCKVIIPFHNVLSTFIDIKNNDNN